VLSALPVKVNLARDVFVEEIALKISNSNVLIVLWLDAIVLSEDVMAVNEAAIETS